MRENAQVLFPVKIGMASSANLSLATGAPPLAVPSWECSAGAPSREVPSSTGVRSLEVPPLEVPSYWLAMTVQPQEVPSSVRVM